MKPSYYLTSGPEINYYQTWRQVMTSNFRPLFSGPKTVQASVTLLEQLPIFIDKSGTGILHQDILPMLYLALESSMAQVGKVEDINLINSKKYFSGSNGSCVGGAIYTWLCKWWYYQKPAPSPGKDGSFSQWGRCKNCVKPSGLHCEGKLRLRRNKDSSKFKQQNNFKVFNLS